jgi:hypothetical protein
LLDARGGESRPAHFRQSTGTRAGAAVSSRRTSAASDLEPDHPAYPVIRAHKERLRRWILARARAGGAVDPVKLSRQLMVVFDGALVQSMVHGSARPGRNAHELGDALIDASGIQ